jgi:hypothetical protein
MNYSSTLKAKLEVDYSHSQMVSFSSAKGEGLNSANSMTIQGKYCRRHGK